MAIVVTDASIKNDIATSISHIHAFNQPMIKMVYHAVFITSTEAELFTIRCSINQTCSIENISKIIVVTGSIYAARKIFDDKSTHIKSIRLQFFANFSISLPLAKKTPLNFGNVQATSSGDSTNQSTRSQSCSIRFLHSLVKYLGTFVEKLTATTLLIYGK